MIEKLLVLCVVVALAHGYSAGAPKEVCLDMVPKHPGTPQTSDAPYTITLSKNKIRANDLVQVKLSANSGVMFKGFFVQGRVGNSPVGAFERENGVNLVNCGKGVQNAATHFSADDKNEVILKWRAPKGLSESVYFNTTIVQDAVTYWVDLPSSRLSVTAN